MAAGTRHRPTRELARISQRLHCLVVMLLSHDLHCCASRLVDCLCGLRRESVALYKHFYDVNVPTSGRKMKRRVTLLNGGAVNFEEARGLQEQAHH